MSADGQQEPSMEDILASIRKILSEDDGEAAKPEPATADADDGGEDAPRRGGWWQRTFGE